MYPFEPLRPAWEELWAAVHERLPWTPATLVWTADVRSCWIDPACTVSHACGWPVATELGGVVRVVGAFTFALAGTDGHRYRSVIVAGDARPLVDRSLEQTVAAVNSDDSLSGSVSLGVAATGDARGWPGPVRWTGSHLASVRAVQEGEADIACIDALTWHHVGRCFPELAGGLTGIGHGPWVPSPPIVTPVATAPDRVVALREAFASAMADPVTAEARRTLALDSLVALDEREYEPLLRLNRAG
jgi:ABC-type phosphate/phosphonate transport system substrate-binding protein